MSRHKEKMPTLKVKIETHGDRLMLFIPEAALDDSGCHPISVSRETAQDLFGLLGKFLQAPEPVEQGQQERIWT